MKTTNKIEEAKLKLGLDAGLGAAFRCGDQTAIAHDLEQIAKSHGIYMQFNRAKTGREKDWMYMVRLSLASGGPVNRQQWRVLDELATRNAVGPTGEASLRLTTRQAIQFHWLDKAGVLDLVKTAAETGILSLNGCGDNVRNIMACPLAARSSVFDPGALGRMLADYFRLPPDPFIKVFAIDPAAIDAEQVRFDYGATLLNRKFKIAISGLIHNGDSWLADNCVELRTNDLGFAPVPDGNRVERVQVYVGGGQGEKLGKLTASMMAIPLGVVSLDGLRPLADAIVAVQRDWGDRENRHHARLKYLIRKRGINWFRARVTDRAGQVLQPSIAAFDPGARVLHHGWQPDPQDGWAFGMFVENGRMIDSSPNGRIRSLVRTLMERFDVSLNITPNQDLLFLGLKDEDKSRWDQVLDDFGFGSRHGRAYSMLRTQSGACVGRDTCRLAYTDSEKFEPFLIDELESMGWGNLATSIGVTGCERQCFRPATKAIGLIGTGRDRYQLKLMGSEDGRNQGVPLRVAGREYLRSIPRDQVAGVLNVLFQAYTVDRVEGESLGYFNRRMGIDGLVKLFTDHPDTVALMDKTVPIKEGRDEFADLATR